MPKRTAASHDEQLSTTLEFLQRMWRLNRALEKLSTRIERQFGVTAQQRLMVRCVGANPGITSGELAKMLHVDPGTVSASLTRLVDKKMLSRIRLATDRRHVQVSVGPKGRTIDRPAHGTVEEAVIRLMKSVPRNELAAFIRVLETLTELLEHEERT